MERTREPHLDSICVPLMASSVLFPDQGVGSYGMSMAARSRVESCHLNICTPTLLPVHPHHLHHLCNPTNQLFSTSSYVESNSWEVFTFIFRDFLLFLYLSLVGTVGLFLHYIYPLVAVNGCRLREKLQNMMQSILIKEMFSTFLISDTVKLCEFVTHHLLFKWSVHYL